jgi:hypothetical protein
LERKTWTDLSYPYEDLLFVLEEVRRSASVSCRIVEEGDCENGNGNGPWGARLVVWKRGRGRGLDGGGQEEWRRMHVGGGRGCEKVMKRVILGWLAQLHS